MVWALGCSAVLLLYFVLALVSLAIDRRALMVSALGYVLYAFSSLLNHAGFVGMGFAVTALLIGGAYLCYRLSGTGAEKRWSATFRRRCRPV